MGPYNKYFEEREEAMKSNGKPMWENPISMSPLVVAVNFKERRSHMSPEALGTLRGVSINLVENI